MIVVLGYDAEGRKVYSANVPSSAEAKSIRGSLVTPEPNWRELERAKGHREAQRRYEAKKKLDAPRPPWRPRLSGDVPLCGRGSVYATDEERIAARRKCWRESSARRRKKAA